MNCGMGRKRSIKSFCRKNTAAVPPQGRAGIPLGGREGQSKNLGRSLSVYHVACREGLRTYEGRSGSATVHRRRRRRRNLLATSNLAVRKVEMKGGGTQRAMARSGVPPPFPSLHRQLRRRRGKRRWHHFSASLKEFSRSRSRPELEALQWQRLRKSSSRDKIDTVRGSDRKIAPVQTQGLLPQALSLLPINISPSSPFFPGSPFQFPTDLSPGAPFPTCTEAKASSPSSSTAKAPLLLPPRNWKALKAL